MNLERNRLGEDAELPERENGMSAFGYDKKPYESGFVRSVKQS